MNLSEVPDAIYYKAMADAYKSSLFATAKHLLGMHEVNEYTHGSVIKALEAPTLRKLLVLPRGTFKCVSPETNIQMPNGKYKQIKDLCLGEQIASWINGHMILAKVIAKETQLNRDMLRIKMRSGITLECSDNHPIMTIKGFLEAKDLPVGKRVAHWAGKVMDQGVEAPKGHAWLLGMMIGDGCTSGKTCAVDIWDGLIMARTLFAVSDCGLELSVRSKKGHFGLLGGKPFLDQYGLSGCTSWTKKIPDIVFSWSLKDRQEFIAAYFSCDGHSYKHGDTYLSTVSKDLAYGMHSLLKTVGVFSVIRYYEYSNAKFYTVTILDSISQRNFLLCPTVMKKRQPGISHQDGFYRSVPAEWRDMGIPKRARARRMRVDNKYDTGFTKFKKFAQEINLEWACTDEIVWDEIICIEKYKGTAIDIEVEGTHTFLADGIVTHNTSLGSVAYPIWLLINNPNLRIMLDSELYTNSKNRLREIKQHLESEKFINIFGDWRTRVWNESEIVIAPRTKILKEASIVCSGIGASKTGEHFDFVIADDLNSAKNSNTAEGCEKVHNHYRMYTSILDPGGTIVVIGTRYSAGDIIQKILDDEISDEQRKEIGVQ